MTDVAVVQILREALMVTIVVSAPILGVGMIVGLIVSIIQTTTSIQEQTLTFVPKIIAIFVTTVVFASWMIHTLVSYTRNVFQMVSKIGAG
jgi:flagellar biosynthetic protein FliQ